MTITYVNGQTLTGQMLNASFAEKLDKLDVRNGLLSMGSLSSANSPAIYFNSSGNANTYDSRILASLGTSINGQGTLTLDSSNIVLTGIITNIINSSNTGISPGLIVSNYNNVNGFAGIGFNSATETKNAKAGIGVIRSNFNGIGPLVFFNANTNNTTTSYLSTDERMRITPGGSLLVGTAIDDAGVSLVIVNGKLTANSINVTGSLIVNGNTITGVPPNFDNEVTGPTIASIVRKTVFIGGVGPRFKTLADPVANAQMIAAGNIGLYRHANGIAPLTSSERTAMYTTWASSGITPTGGGQSVGEVGGYTTTVDAGYLSYFGGSYPPEVNMNILTNSGGGTGTYTATSSDRFPGTVYQYFTTPGDLNTMKAAIASAFVAGAKNVAIFMTPNSGGEDLDDPFATAGYWANVRAAALAGGGIALDVPPTYWVTRGTQYQSLVTQMVQWANANNIRSSFTVSPSLAPVTTPGDPLCGYDPVFYDNTLRLISVLTAANAMPTQWIVENYGAVSGCDGSNDVQTDTTPNSLNAVALLLARTTKTSTQGTAIPTVTGGLAEIGLMDTPVTVSRVRNVLPTTNKIGPIRLADVAGFGNMAAQNSGDVMITGGTINGPLNITTTSYPFFQIGAVIGGPTGNAVIIQTDPPGTLNLVLPGGAAASLNVSNNLTVSQNAIITGNIACNSIVVGGYNVTGILSVTKIAASGTSQALAFATSGDKVYDITLTANCTLTLSGGVAGQQQAITVYLRQDSTAGRTVTLPTGIRWTGGTPPTLGTTAGNIDVFVLKTPDAGVTVFGSY